MVPVIPVTIKIVQSIIPCWSKSTAQRKIDQCRDALKKSKNGIVSVHEFIEYYELENIQSESLYGFKHS